MNDLVKTETNWTPEQMKLITDVVAKGATPDELKLFLYRCQHMGLDPLKPGQIYFMKYGAGPGTIVVGIEGFRSKAARTGKLAGIKRGAIRDAKGALLGGWAEVYRSDWKEPAREEVPLAEYNSGKSVWQKMPETMIKKVAEAAALRMAFPDDLGGIYTQEEMHQAEEKSQLAVHAEQPAEGDGIIPTNSAWTCSFGKFAKRTVEQVAEMVGVDGMRDYVDYLERTAAKEGKPIQGKVKELIDQFSGYIAAFESGPVEDDVA